MHLDDERVQRLLHNELEPAGEQVARQHLAICEDCRMLVDEARVEEQRIFGLFREVDHPLPEADPRVILAVGHGRSGGLARWAAGLLLLAAAGGAAYAAPGSPLPALLDRLAASLAPAPSPQSPAATDTTPPGAGIAVVPGDRLTIRFVVDDDDARATVSLTEGDEVLVRAVTGAATFSSEVDRLSVRSAGAARFEILVPRSAPWVDILADDAPVFRKRAAEVLAETQPGADGRYDIRLSSPTP